VEPLEALHRDDVVDVQRLGRRLQEGIGALAFGGVERIVGSTRRGRAQRGENPRCPGGGGGPRPTCLPPRGGPPPGPADLPTLPVNDRRSGVAIACLPTSNQVKRVSRREIQLTHRDVRKSRSEMVGSHSHKETADRGGDARPPGIRASTDYLPELDALRGI